MKTVRLKGMKTVRLRRDENGEAGKGMGAWEVMGALEFQVASVQQGGQGLRSEAQTSASVPWWDEPGFRRTLAGAGCI